jgi:1-acyl-sn-glycerol-3-phosphate acyltransferase
MDPFIVLATIPYLQFVSFLPIRFFTYQSFLAHWWQRIVLIPLGCFPAQSQQNEVSGVKGGIHFLSQKQTLFIFPEGERVGGTKEVEPKVGIGYIAEKVDITVYSVCIVHTPKRVIVHWLDVKKFDSSTVQRERNHLMHEIFSPIRSTIRSYL